MTDMAIFDDSYTAVMLGQPFFGSLLSKLAIEETKSIKTAAIAPGKLLYNGDYFATLSDDEGIFAITHEIMHECYQHLVEMDMYGQSGIGPDGKPYDHQRYNEAADYVINDLLVLNQIGKIKPGWLHSSNFNHTMIPAEVYCKLPPSPPGGGGRGKNGQGQSSQDEHLSDGAANDPNGIQPSDVLQAYEHAKAMGDVPAGLDRLIGGIEKPKHSPWAMLRSAYLSATKGNDTSTWRRLNRRALSHGLVMPGRTGFACGDLAVVIDTSGSIGDDMIKLFAGHVGAMLTEAKPTRIHLIWCDATVHRVDTIKTGADLMRIVNGKIPGGGGTDIERGITEASRLKCEIAIALTDMYTPFTHAPKGMKVIWGATTDVVAPYGKTVKLT